MPTRCNNIALRHLDGNFEVIFVDSAQRKRPLFSGTLLMNTLVFKWTLYFYFIARVFLCTASDTNSATFVILGQRTTYDDSKAETLRNLIYKEAKSLEKSVDVLVPHKDMPEVLGFWAIWPLFPRITSLVSSDWYVFLELDSFVNTDTLYSFLKEFLPTDKVFLGHGLLDKEPTIIHHFYGFDNSEDRTLPFPDFAGGVVLSKGLITNLTIAMKTSGERILSSFTIDAKHELALFVYKISGIVLSSHPNRFCLFEGKECAVFYKASSCVSDTGFSQDSIFVAVKTFSGNHDTRLPVIKSTWGSHLPFVVYFSDTADDGIPTVDSGVRNTERGHCAKTFAILKYFSDLVRVNPKRSESLSWLVVVDDDTLVSIPRLLKLLSCYSTTEMIIIGERYGYGFSISGSSGYDYPTGGSGMVFSLSAVKTIIKRCQCPAENSPDDMFIGICARRNDIVVVHNAAFHQARHIDYPESYLRRLPPISFHKFEDIDPFNVYMTYLQEPLMEEKSEL